MESLYRDCDEERRCIMIDFVNGLFFVWNTFGHLPFAENRKRPFTPSKRVVQHFFLAWIKKKMLCAD